MHMPGGIMYEDKPQSTLKDDGTTTLQALGQGCISLEKSRANQSLITYGLCPPYPEVLIMIISSFPHYTETVTYHHKQSLPLQNISIIITLHPNLKLSERHCFIGSFCIIASHINDTILIIMK